VPKAQRQASLEITVPPRSQTSKAQEKELRRIEKGQKKD